MKINIVEMLAEHEEAISRLYDAYAKKFPDQKEFWATLSGEELEHARLIHQLDAKVKEGSAVFDPEKLKASAIQISIDYLKNELANAQKKEMTLINALSVALNIEKSIIDGKFFEAFKGYSKEAKRILHDLSETVKKHYNKIEKTWSEHRKFS